MSSGKFQDKLLYLQLKQKDRDAFVKAYDLYLNDIYRFVYFKVGSREEAEDLTSSVFLRAWDYIQSNTLKDYRTLKSLFYKIARNLIIDHYRKKSSQPSFSLEDSGIDIGDEKQDLVKSLELASEFGEMERSLLKLKDEYREAVMLRFVNELSVSEIAEVLDKTKGNVRVLLHRAISALKKIAEEDRK